MNRPPSLWHISTQALSLHTLQQGVPSSTGAVFPVTHNCTVLASLWMPGVLSPLSMDWVYLVNLLVDSFIWQTFRVVPQSEIIHPDNMLPTIFWMDGRSKGGFIKQDFAHSKCCLIFYSLLCWHYFLFWEMGSTGAWGGPSVQEGEEHLWP